MLVLTQTTDTVQVVLGGTVATNQLPVYSAFRDITTTAYTPGRRVVNTNNTTAVDAVQAPSASTQRVVDTLSVWNADTATASVTVRLNDNGTTYVLWSGSLRTGERVEYCDGSGFRVFSADGREIVQNQQVYSSVAASAWNVVKLTSGIQTNTTANTLVDITGLSFAVVAGTDYAFQAFVNFATSGTANGGRLTVTGPTSPTYSAYRSGWATTATLSTDAVTEMHGSAYDLPSTVVGTLGYAAGNLCSIEGVIRPSVDGTVQLRMASEGAGPAAWVRAEPGSFLQWMQL